METTMRNIFKQRITFEYVDSIIRYMAFYKGLEFKIEILKSQMRNDGEEGDCSC